MNNPVDGISSPGSFSNNQTRNIKETAEKAKQGVSDTITEPSTQEEADQIVLTDSAKRIQAIEKQLEAEPIVDRNRVNEIRVELASGFSPNAENIADKLLETEKLLS